MRSTITRSHRIPRGLSLVELLVALTLGLVLATALVQAYVANRGVFTLQDSVSRLQEGGRFALGFMGEDVRMAGFIGCPSIDRLGGARWHDHAGSGMSSNNIIRSQNDVAQGNTRQAMPGSDVLVIRKAVSQGRSLVSPVGAGDDVEIEILGAGDIADGRSLIVSDCISADVFSVVGASSTAGEPPITTLTASRLAATYGADAEVFEFESVEYFVADTGRGTTALYIDRDGQVEELVEGIEDLQLQFGIDSSGDDRTADEYVDQPVDWSQVVSVHINLLTQSVDENVVPSSGVQAQSVEFMGAPVAADGRLRQVFSSTVAIRNRLP